MLRAHQAPVFNLVFNHSGRAEIVQVAQRFAHERRAAADIDEAAISAALATAGLPDIDLVIRTAGEQRLSNFLLWQSAYAVVHTVAAPWPAFTQDDLHAALDQYCRAQSRTAQRAEYQKQPAVVVSDAHGLASTTVPLVQA